MRIFLLVLIGLLALAALLHGLSFYPIRLRLRRENGAFLAKLSFLFYSVTLADTEHPVDLKDFTDRKWKKKRRLLLSRSKERRFHRFRRAEHAPPRRAFARTLFYAKLVTRLFRVLGAENVKHLSLSVRRLTFFYSTGDPASDSILSAFFTNALASLFSALSSVARVRVRAGSTLFLPDFPNTEADLSFSIILSMPLFYYLSIFHAFIPTSDRVLKVLAKRKEALEKRNEKQMHKRKGAPIWRKTIFRRSSRNP